MNTINEVIEMAQSESSTLITGLTNTAKAHIVANIGKTKPIFIITHSELRAKELQEDISFFASQDAKIYPAKDIIFFSADVRSITITAERFSILQSLLKKQPLIIIATADALLDKLAPKEEFEKAIMKLAVGDVKDINQLAKNLAYMGYERRDPVEYEGQFAIRGGIFDLYSPTSQWAYRLEFFGDELDSIRTIDTASQKSIEKIDEITIFPMRELVYTNETLKKAIAKMEREYRKTLDNFQKNNSAEEADRLKENVGESLQKLIHAKSLPDIDKFFAYFYEGESLLSYIPEDTVLYFDEPNKINACINTALAEFSESKQNRILKGHILPGQANMFFDINDLQHIWGKFTNVLLMTLPGTPAGFAPKALAQLRTREISLAKNNVDYLCQELEFFCEKKVEVNILTKTPGKGQRLKEELDKRGVRSRYNVLIGSLTQGFEYLDNKLAYISEKEVFSTRKKRKGRQKAVNIEDFTDLKVGDYIVHDNHGIGVYNGLETILTDNVSKDYLKLSYGGGGKLYISITQMDRIQKYIGNSSVSLSRLGGVSWEKAKARVKETVKVLAEDLALLYAQRNIAQGFVYTKDTVWQAEFESTFPFQETDDQLVAIEDVKKDMESTKIMDRLVCGDVGFGKTEIALRASFKAVQDNKQVAFLVPTTILAQQHYMTFLERMKNFPINIELLSRFRSKKEQSQTVNRLANGQVDIVIGTHRLLSKDVVFSNLGLVVVDEEQRFGVTHKEKLKKLTINVDVLTLTATPIPRTLHMSLSGVRDISLLQEPPTSRKNIQTFVLEYDKEFVKTAITREMARGGQIYYLHNRVKNIATTAKTLMEIVPSARISYAHGRMGETALEKVMMDFIGGEIDVLVCTTIIETGLDIPNVNTIIIQDADHMGLAQLYQLRGRVGRSDKIAYSYLMYKKDKILTQESQHRLQTIRDFTEFGSGFKVALKDLEIRGVGSMLGAQQHGHMAAIGYGMYTRLLEEAVKELKGETVQEAPEISIDIKISAYIPSEYIPSAEQKLDIYKKISHIKNREDFCQIQDEIEDRYGNMPKPVEGLLNIAFLKAVAAPLGITTISQKDGGNLLVMFSHTATVDPNKIVDAVTKNGNLLFTSGDTPHITYKVDKELKLGDVVALRELLARLGE
ncbi:MAG: transcription-repair coupling factor [Defluviitaleaceae bacterium]|nr:transcription-repair coupling factor [Defluviitaleaceae bacterium]